MNTFTESQLDAKISAFMARKKDISSLNDRHMTPTMAPVRAHRETKRKHLLLPLQLRVQY